MTVFLPFTALAMIRSYFLPDSKSSITRATTPSVSVGRSIRKAEENITSTALVSIKAITTAAYLKMLAAKSERRE